MAWTRAIVTAVLCIVLTGCTMGNRSTAVDRITLEKGQRVQCYRLVAIHADGRAEFGNVDVCDTDSFAHLLAAPGQHFGLEVEGKHLIRYEFQVENTDFAKQQATIVGKATRED